MEVNFYAALALQTSAKRAEHKSRTTHTHTHTQRDTQRRVHTPPRAASSADRLLLSDHHHCSRRSGRRRSDIGALAHCYPFLRGIRSGGTNFGTTGAGRGPRDRKVACEACVEAVEREHDERSPRRSLS